ncbi:hypothetical protein D3C80_1476230 [compost metagenome]
MKKLELVQMEGLEGGRCTPTDAQAQILIMGAVGGMLFGPLGALGYGLFAIYVTDGGSHCM